MGQFKTHDFLVETDKKGRYVRTIMPPHRSLIPQYKFVNGEKVLTGYELAPKGYGMPHKANNNNNDIAIFGSRYARRFRHDKRKRRFA